MAGPDPAIHAVPQPPATATNHPMPPESDHFDGKRFFNPGQPSTDRSLRELLRWRLTGARAPWPPPPAPTPSATPARRVATLAVTGIGHASLLIQADGLNILVDPVWSDRASPLPFLGPKRWNAPGVAFDALPPIDAVLLTHNHYDHLDAPTLRRLCAAHAPRIVAPLGNGALLARLCPGARIDTADWGARIDLSPTTAITLHPAYHWSARTPFDRRRALWCGYVLTTPRDTVYIAGDTAYGDGAPFHRVRQRFGPPTLAILPIGAYEPRWFMRAQHMNPEDAVQAMLDCGAPQALGIHWGTFQLTDEPRTAPLQALTEACTRHALNPQTFQPLNPSQTWPS